MLVVDDGSNDRPEEVTRNYPWVTVLRQTNQGLAAARNTGLEASNCDRVVFLDADDLLTPTAIANGLCCFRSAPKAAFVYGAHRRVDSDGTPLGEVKYSPLPADGFRGFLRGNYIGMHATVMYDRSKLVAAGGFDPTLRRCEDYDLYLRLSRKHQVACHSAVVADYRWHGENMSADHRDMLEWVLRVLDRHRRSAAEAGAMADWQAGRRIWAEYYAEQTLADARNGSKTRERGRRLMTAFGMSPRSTVGRAARALARHAERFAPQFISRRLRRAMGRPATPRLGQVRLGDFAGTRPICPDFGFSRGTPVDRYYVEQFLSVQRKDIRGRVLEIGDDTYSRQFGDSIDRQDVLHVSPGNPHATIVGDLSTPGLLPDATFDCLVITQTLHLIYDMPSAIREMFRALKPGGVALLTSPGISQIDRGDWGATWFWSLTTASAQRLFGDVFGESEVTVQAYGNVFSATCFLQGLALEEVDRRKLDVLDSSYPVIITIRARKAP